MTRPGYPNAHARLHLAQRSPSTPARDHDLEIWLSGTRFRVRDPSGRRTAELVADATAARGLGAPARTIEEMMDRHTAASNPRPSGPPTELYGDIATDTAWVFPSDGTPFETSASKLAPIAEQILAGTKSTGLSAFGAATRLGRTATEYRGTVQGSDAGVLFENRVVRIIAPPFLLLDDARNAGTGNSSYVRELLTLDEGTVTDADVTPPAIPPSD